MYQPTPTADTVTAYSNMNPSSTTANVYTISAGSPAFIVIDEYEEFINDVEELEREPVNLAFPLWPDLYEDIPHRVPNHYPPAPRKMLPKRISGKYYNPLKLKQPVARSGFKRGQRR